MNPFRAIREFLYFVTYPVRMLARLPASIISAPGRFLGLTLPTRVALVLGFSLLIVWVVSLVLNLKQKGTVDWDRYIFKELVLLVLIVVAALIARLVVKTWLEKGFSRFPEIDRAWDAGVAALRARNIDLLDTPLVLVLGVGSRGDADALMQATGLRFAVDGESGETNCLHWYANSDVIYLVCTETCVLGALRARLMGADERVDRGSDLIRQTINPEGGVRGTADMSARAIPRSSPEPEPAAVSHQPAIRGTMQLDSVPAAAHLTTPPAGSASLAMKEKEERTAKLEYVCQRLKLARQPICPCNGLLTLLPVELIKRGEWEGVEVQIAARSDTEKVRQTLMLRCPVVALVSGMESEPGFRELVRRVGRDRAKNQRFGQRFGVWNPPMPDQVEALASRACQAFETFSYALFQERDGLTQFGNRKLYSLLCCVRSTLRKRLVNILVGAFADESSKPYGSGSALLLSGCYFAATGGTEDRQAFVKAVVVDRFLKEDLVDSLDWAEDALQEDRRYHYLAQAGLVLDGVLFLSVLALGVMWYNKWFS